MSSHSTLADSARRAVEDLDTAENSAADALERKADSEHAEKASSVHDDPPDGGYGWVVVACCFLVNAVTWGCNAAFGVFLSFYRQNNYFPGATDIEFAFIGGLSISVCVLVAPFVNYLSKRYHFKVPMTGGIVVYVLSQIFAGLSKQIWQLFLTQGVMFGMGLGLLFVPSLPLSNQWFAKRRALASGVSASGSGAGGLVLAITTRVIIERLGLKWAFFINAFISLAVLVPCVFLLKSRVHIIHAKFEPIQYQLLWHPGFVYVWIWGCFSLFGYVLALYTLPTYSTAGLGLSQAKGSSLQSLLGAGQIIGRPLSGLLMDRFGRINMASFLTFIAGLSCLVVWLVARSYGVLVFFAFVQGMFGGVFWGSCAPVIAEVVGLRDLGSALSILWLAIVIPSTFSEPIGVWLLNYSTTHLKRRGADAFLISIGFSGGSFFTAAIVLFGAKRWKQRNWKILVKT